MRQELSTLESRLAEIDRREQQIRDLAVEIDKLKERIGNGKEKIAGQKTLIAAAEQAQKILSENSAGKEAYEKAEKHLIELREQLKLQRQLEQKLAELKTTVSKLEERYKGEAKAIEQTGRSLKPKRIHWPKSARLSRSTRRWPDWPPACRKSVKRSPGQEPNSDGWKAATSGWKRGRRSLQRASVRFSRNRA